MLQPVHYADLSRQEMHPFVPMSTQRLLDVGCNRGAFGLALKERGVGEVWGIEMSTEAAAVAATRLDKVLTCSFEEADLPDQYFDAISFNDVLEHMVDPAAALRVAAGKLRPGGVVVASIPNLRNFDNLMHIMREKDFRYEDMGIRDSTHLRFFTLKSIPRLFDSGGFEIIQLEGIKENWWTPSVLRRVAFKLFPDYLSDTRHLQYAIVAKSRGATNGHAPG